MTDVIDYDKIVNDAAPSSGPTPQLDIPVPAPGATGPSPIDYENLVGQTVEQQQRQQFLETLKNSKDIIPERQAQAISIAQTRGVPVGVAYKYLDELKPPPTQVDYDSMTHQAPQTAKLLADPVKGPVAFPDAQPLADIEKNLKAFTSVRHTPGILGAEMQGPPAPTKYTPLRDQIFGAGSTELTPEQQDAEQKKILKRRSDELKAIMWDEQNRAAERQAREKIDPMFARDFGGANYNENTDLSLNADKAKSTELVDKFANAYSNKPTLTDTGAGFDALLAGIAGDLNIPGYAGSLYDWTKTLIDPNNPDAGKGNFLTRLGDEYSKATAQLFPGDKVKADELWVQFMGAIGTMGPILATAWATGGTTALMGGSAAEVAGTSGVSAALMGSSAQVEQAKQEMTDFNLTPTQRAIYGLGNAAIGLLDVISAEKFLGLAEETGGRGLSRILAGAIKQFAVEGSTEGGQQILQDTLAKYLFDPARDVIGNAINAFAVGGLAGGVLGTLHMVANSAAEKNHERLLALGEAARKMKLADLSREIFDGHIGQLKETGDIPEHVTAPVKSVLTLFQELTTDQILDQFPQTAKSLAEAQQHQGGDEKAAAVEVTIPTEELLRLGKLKGYNNFTTDVRVGDDLTFNEKMDQTKQILAELGKMDTSSSTPQEETPFFQNLRDQLVAAGQSKEVATTQARLFDAVFNNLSERTGVPVADLARRYGVTISNTAMENAAGQTTLQQRGPGTAFNEPAIQINGQVIKASDVFPNWPKGSRPAGGDGMSISNEQAMADVNLGPGMPEDPFWGHADLRKIAADKFGADVVNQQIEADPENGFGFVNAQGEFRSLKNLPAATTLNQSAKSPMGDQSAANDASAPTGNAQSQDQSTDEQSLDNEVKQADEQAKAEGGKDIRADQVDALVDDDRIPVITLADLIGKTIFPTIADRTAAGALYRGIDGSKLEISIPLLGGPLFPLRLSNILNNVVWGNRGESVVTSKGKKIAAGAKYMAVLMGDADMHQSNTTVANSFFATLEAYARDGRVTPENSAQLVELVKNSPGESEPIRKALKAFPGVTDAKVLDKYLHGISFDARKRLLAILGTKAAQDLGAPSMTKILRATREQSMATHRWGDAVLIVEIDEGQPFVKLGDQGTMKHPDFPLGIRGKVVGKLATPINYELLWQDYLKEKNAKGLEDRNARVTEMLAKAAASETDADTQKFLKDAEAAAKRDPNNRRAFELARPELKITKDLVNRIGDIRANNIDGFRQAKLATDMVTRNWRRSDVAKNKGGVSPQAFLDAVANSDYSATLTQYDLAYVKKGIKDGSWLISQLGDGEIYYALKRGNPGYAEDYGFQHPAVTDNEVTVVSVVNNEQGARGIAGPAILLDAIENGATMLDCFGVQTPKFPAGFLPSLYGAFGFEKIGEIPFDPQYYDKNKLADVEAAWSKDGWVKDRDGYPPLVIMKWSGTDADRAGILERYLQRGVEGLLSAGAGEHAEAVAGFVGNPSGAEAGTEAGANSGGTAGDQGARRGASLSSRARDVVAAIAGLNDAELRNLGLTRAQQQQIIKSLAKAPETGPSSSGQTTLFQETGNHPLYDETIDRVVKDRDVKAIAVRTVEDLVNIADVMKSWKDWYDRYEGVLREFLGSDHEAQLFQELLSATSQMASVKANVGLAIKAYDQLKSGQPFEGYLPAVIKNLERIRNNEALRGPKISQYGDASRGKEDAIAVDRHIAMIIFDVKSPSPKQRAQAMEMVREVATRLGWAPREVQAALWAGNQILLGTPEEKIGSYDVELIKRGEALKQLFRDIQSRNGVVRGEGGSASQVGGSAAGTAEAGAAGQGAQSLNQGGKDIRGSISFGPLRDHFRITLTEKANLSTFLHEGGHFFLEVLQDLVERGEASAQQVTDLKTLRKWMGLKDGEAVNVAGHEKFARTFEEYLMEGKAPSLALHGIFQKFKAWMIFVYKRLANVRGSLNDEIRTVMDRLVASDAAIAEARAMVGWRGNPLSQEQTGLDDAGYKAYVAQWTKANDAQSQDADARIMLEAARELKKTWADEKTKVTQEVEKALAETRGWKAWKLLENGEGLEDYGRTSLKIDPDTVPKEWGHTAKGLTAPADAGGMPLDLVAEILGYDTGEQMLQVIGGARLTQKAIPARVRQIMVERHGEMDAAQLSQEAMKAVHNTPTMDVLLTEFRALAEKANMKVGKDTARMIMATAQDRVAQIPGRKLEPAKWRRAEVKAAEEAGKYAAQGKATDAALAKRRQMMAAAMAKASLEAQDRIGAIKDYLATFTTNRRRAALGKAGDAYLDQVDQILEAIQFKDVSLKAIKARQGLDEFLKAQEAAGEPVFVSDDTRALLGRRNYTEMTLQELEGVHDAVKNLWTVAKEINTVRKEGQKIALENALADIAKETEATLAVRKKTPHLDSMKTRVDKVMDGIGRYHAGQLKAEFILDWLGQTAHSLVYQPISDAYYEAWKLHRDITAPLMDKIKHMPREQAIRWNTKRQFLNYPGPLKGANIWTIALNMGNASNKEKMLTGYGWTESQVMAELNTFMKKEDWDLVQETLDTIEKMWPKMSDVVKRATGLTPPKIEATPIETPYGTYRGGYFPVVYDTQIDAKMDDVIDSSVSTEEMFSKRFTAFVMNNGFTKGRTKVTGKLLFEPDIITQHLGEVIHYATHYDAVKQADKIMRTQAFKQLVRDHLGDDVYKELKQWLKDVATNTTRSDRVQQAGDRFFRWARNSAQLTSLGLNIKSAIFQPLGIITTMDALRQKHFWIGIQKAWLSPNVVENWREAFEHSKELAPMIKNYDRDAAAAARAYADSIGKKTGARIYELAFMPIGVMQSVANVAAWHGAYSQAIEDRMTAQQAYDFADKIVRTTQGGGALKDLSGMQRGGEANKFFTMFYSYYGVQYNRMADIQMRERGVKNIHRKVGRYTTVLLLNSILGTLFNEGWNQMFPPDKKRKEDDQTIFTRIALDAIDNTLNSFPVYRDAYAAMSAIVSGGQQRTPPALGGVAKAIAGAKSLYDVVVNDKDMTRAKGRNIAALVSVASTVGGGGLPVYGVYKLLDDILASSGHPLFDK